MSILASAASGTTEDSASFAGRLTGHSPLSLFGITRTSADGQHGTGMNPGPWMTDDGGSLRPGSLAVLLDLELSSPLFTGRPSARAGLATSELSIDFVADAALLEGPLTATASVIQKDEDGGLVRGQAANDGGIVAIATLAGRYLKMAEDYRGAVDLNPGRPDPSLTMRQVFTHLPHVTAQGAALSVLSSPWLANPRGVMHGGILAVLAEYVASSALDGGGGAWQPSSLRINYLRPSPLGEVVSVRAVRIQQGRKLALVKVETLRPDGKHITSAQVSFTRKSVPADSPGRSRN
ncbi:PaaI family thioesterase [Arthrobacter sp. MMS18-M83]|uniref:PaaI family thioesterase n=1 Tax=Arthrobacter sp. MMS18-M83 TaxID=2996261 RepID=UPI00227B6176|nr:PaaI family thioesterase [Arthrobacter sp. MMS18-M83]WAH97667.1 PaaI family thioesterase [Arthrobacter sp. MMS18-M83]